MEENKINEAQVSEVEIKKIDEKEGDQAKKKNWISDFYVEVVLFLILGILIGFAVKTEAAKRITMGFSDYKMKIFEKGYDINELEKKLIQKNLEEANSAGGSTSEEVEQSTVGGSCQ